MKSAQKTTVDDARIVPLDKHLTEVGSLVVYGGSEEHHFMPLRTYFLYDVPARAERGGHAHKKLRQILVALSGSFEVILDDGHNQVVVQLNQPTQGLSLPPGLWRELRNFSGGSICLVLASEEYDEDDYIRNYDEFKCWK